MKIDCSNILNFKKEYKRMCKTFDDCKGCPFDNDDDIVCEYRSFEDITQDHVNAVQKWSDEHPQKTILEDFLEKYPNAKKRSVDGLTCFCLSLLGYKNVKICTSPQFEYGENCISCWNRLLEEVDKE